MSTGHATKVKNPGPEDPALVSPHRGVINISLHMVGILEYWNIGKNRNVANCRLRRRPPTGFGGRRLKKLIAFRNPSLHYSIIPVGLFTGIANGL
jgi:hypothetical protein